jgi:hypothetical protein
MTSGPARPQAVTRRPIRPARLECPNTRSRNIYRYLNSTIGRFDYQKGGVVIAKNSGPRLPVATGVWEVALYSTVIAISKSNI